MYVVTKKQNSKENVFIYQFIWKNLKTEQFLFYYFSFSFFLSRFFKLFISKIPAKI